VRAQVTCVVFRVCVKAYLAGKLGREAAPERDRERVLTKLARAFGMDPSTGKSWVRGEGRKKLPTLSETGFWRAGLVNAGRIAEQKMDPPGDHLI
jgi:hypothetical protein